MNDSPNLADIRRDYGTQSLDEEHLSLDPITQFKLWFADALKQEIQDPTAMVLSTVDDQNRPDSRVVLLKGLESNNFIFYTNYLSNKGQQIKNHPHAALNFYWPQMARQIRIRGSLKKTSTEISDTYFASRPINSQLSAIASPQSQEIKSLNELEQVIEQLTSQQSAIKRPAAWGGYQLIPIEIEFWQGRDNRLHDRIHYYQQDGKWKHHRLAP